jgi:hypothetical protein
MPVAGLQLNEVLEHGVVRLEPFAQVRCRDHLGWALWFAPWHGLAPSQLSCLRVLWPDKRGRFPSDSDCVPSVRDDQTAKGQTH